MATTTDTDEIWRPAIADRLPMRCWDGDYVVYNPLSGNTHVLDIVTGEVLKSVMAGTIRTSELRKRVADFLEVPNDDRIADHVDRILRALDRQALIEPANGC